MTMRYASLLALLAGVTIGFAQDEPTPPAQPAQPAQPEEETAAPAPKLNRLTLRYSAFLPHGNRNSLYRQGMLSNGPAIEELTYLIPGNDAAPYYRLDVHDLPDHDYWVSGYTISAGGDNEIRFTRQNRRFREPGITPTGTSSDLDTSVEASHSFGSLGVYAYAEDRQRKLRPEAPRVSQNPRTQRIAAGFSGQFGSVNAGIDASQLRYTDSSGTQPTAVQQFAGIHATTDLGSFMTITGAFGGTWIRQNGLADSSIRTYSLAGEASLGDSALLQFDLNQSDLSLPNVLSAYDRQRMSAGARLLTRTGGWSLQLGFRHREAERVRADRSFVDVPKWNTYDFRASKQIAPSTRLTVRGSWDDLTAASVPNTQDARQLLWDDKSFAQAKVDFFNDSFIGYASYTYRFRQNKARLVELDWHNFTLGASKQFNESLSGYGELTYDFFRGGEQVQGVNETLNYYFPDSFAIGTGFNYSLSPQAVLSVGMNTFSSANVWGTQVSASYRRQLTEDRALEIAFSPWSVRDRLLGQTGYGASIFTLRYSIQF